MRLGPRDTDGAGGVMPSNGEEVPNSEQCSGQAQETESRQDECGKHACCAALRRRIGIVGRTQPITLVGCSPLLGQRFVRALCRHVDWTHKPT